MFHLQRLSALSRFAYSIIKNQQARRLWFLAMLRGTARKACWLTSILNTLHYIVWCLKFWSAPVSATATHNHNIKCITCRFIVARSRRNLKLWSAGARSNFRATLGCCSWPACEQVSAGANSDKSFCGFCIISCQAPNQAHRELIELAGWKECCCHLFPVAELLLFSFFCVFGGVKVSTLSFQR